MLGTESDIDHALQHKGGAGQEESVRQQRSGRRKPRRGGEDEDEEEEDEEEDERLGADDEIRRTWLGGAMVLASRNQTAGGWVCAGAIAVLGGVL